MDVAAVIVDVVAAATVSFSGRAFGLEPGAVASSRYVEASAAAGSLIAFAARSSVEEQLAGHGGAPAGLELVLVTDDVGRARCPRPRVRPRRRVRRR